ncbi:MAG: TlpA family protein disulfide reductase [Gammaproteobacteria bacterium]|nr:TlpA family protein disulfide reductase [Gammaproteobacteria bacterium]
MTKSAIAAVVLALSLGTAHAEKTFDLLAEPRPAPAFELTATRGGTVSLSDFRGQYVLVNFWAVWCTPCRKEMPSMQRSYDRLRGPRFEMVAIHVGPTLEQAGRFAEDLGLTFPILVDEDMRLNDWNVMGLPSTYLVDPEGRIVARAVGEREWDSPAMMQRLEEMLGSAK